MKVGAPAPPELLKWELAERYGWTLDYIRGLTMKEIQEFYQIADAKYKAHGGR